VLSCIDCLSVCRPVGVKELTIGNQLTTDHPARSHGIAALSICTDALSIIIPVRWTRDVDYS